MQTVPVPAHYPTHVRVFHLTYAIRWIDNVAERGSNRFGWCDSSQHQVIGVCYQQQPAQIAETFLHEVIHAINEAVGNKDGSPEEQFTANIATGLVLFWQLNPDVAAWWQSLIQSSHSPSPTP